MMGAAGAGVRLRSPHPEQPTPEAACSPPRKPP